MTFKVKTSILYIEDEDLKIKSMYKDIDNINQTDISDRGIVLQNNVVIFKRGKKLKVLKSRY